MNTCGKLIVLSGPSGVGKSTVVSKAMEKRSDICFSTSVTTRAPRPGEVNGKDYFFIDQVKFDAMVANDELLEHASYVSNSYGTPRAFVETQLEKGVNVVLDIEVQGARQIYEKMSDAIFVFILPPSLEELERRLRSRGTDSDEVIRARLVRARQEMQEAIFYDYMIVNNEIERAAEDFAALIRAEHCRFDRNYILKLVNHG